MISAGLNKAQLLPTGSGYLEAGAALTRLRGPEGWLEAGWRATDSMSLYGQGYLTPQDAGVMAGVRWVW